MNGELDKAVQSCLEREQDNRDLKSTNLTLNQKNEQVVQTKAS